MNPSGESYVTAVLGVWFSKHLCLCLCLCLCLSSLKTTLTAVLLWMNCGISCVALTSMKNVSPLSFLKEDLYILAFGFYDRKFPVGSHHCS